MSKHKSFPPGGNKRFSKSPKDRDDKDPKLGYIPEEMMTYYRQVSATLEAGFEDNDPSVKREFLNNVYLALKDEGIKASQNQTVSRILEFLLTHSETMHLRTLFPIFCNDLTTVSFDRFSSHVFQSLIQYLPIMYDEDNMKVSDKDSLKTSLDQLCQFTIAQMRQFTTDTYGSHVLRSLLETLGGVLVNAEVIRSHVSRNQRKDTDITPQPCPVSKQLCADFKPQFDKIKDKVLSLCNYTDHLTDANYCPVLQTILLILHKSNTLEYDTLANTIMEKACQPREDPDKENVEKNLPAIVQDGVGSFLVELLVSLTSDSEIAKLYQTLFKGKLIYFSVHPVANYVLQKLLACISNLDILKEIVIEMSPFMEDVLAVNHVGVLVKLAEACKRNQDQQEEFSQALLKAFHCADPKERHQKLVPLIAAMQTYDVFYSAPAEKEKKEDSSEQPPLNLLKSVNIHGSLLLQQMLFFDRPKHTVASLLSLTGAELSNLASDQCGSHVVEAFFNSTTVWDRNKEEFLKKIKGFYIPVACSKNGSRCIEGIWKVCSLKMKALIAEELVKSRERMESDKFGHFLYRNFALFKFSTRKKEWMDFQSGTKKKKEMLEAILEGNAGRKKKNRKRKANSDDAKENEKQPTDTDKNEDRLGNGDSGGDTEGAVISVGKKRKANQEDETSNCEEGEEKKHKTDETNGTKSPSAKKKRKNKKRKTKKKKAKA